MKPKWSHLPNAKYIDRILAHVKTDSVAGDARSVARSAAWDAALPSAWDAAWDAALPSAWDAAWDAILALVAWDHAGALLDLPAEQVRVLALLGQPAAVLMYPVALAMENAHVK